MSPLSLSRTLTSVQSLAMTVLPHGGQRSARQNAWAAMSADATRARGRREAELSMERAIARSAVRRTASSH